MRYRKGRSVSLWDAPFNGISSCNFGGCWPGVERAGPPPWRTVHEGMFRETKSAPGSDAPHYPSSPTLMRGWYAHASCEFSIPFEPVAQKGREMNFRDDIWRVKRRWKMEMHLGLCSDFRRSWFCLLILGRLRFLGLTFINPLIMSREDLVDFMNSNKSFSDHPFRSSILITNENKNTLSTRSNADRWDRKARGTC